MRRRLTPLVALGALVFSACGGDDGATLSPEAEAGRDVLRSNGCASCHGANGQGGVGPSFEGLYGNAVTLADGSTVIADREYLRESITNPEAKIVEGYRLPMPTNDLSDDEIASVIDFIAALGEEGSEP